MTKVGLVHGMVRSLQNQASPFNSFAVDEVAMAVPKNYIKQKTANINVKNRVYIQVLQTHNNELLEAFSYHLVSIADRAKLPLYTHARNDFCVTMSMRNFHSQRHYKLMRRRDNQSICSKHTIEYRTIAARDNELPTHTTSVV